MPTTLIATGFLSLFLTVCMTDLLSAQQTNTRLSNAQKCEIYRTAFEKVEQNSITHQLTESFRRENRDFINSGCVEYTFVCPRSLADIAAANELTVATMNRGLASTFVPFKCPKPQ